jgi:hypothetical protein
VSNPVEIKLCDEDRKKYGGDEWLPFDLSEYTSMDGDALIALEEGMGMSFFRLRRIEMPEGTLRATKAIAWLARQRAGLTVPKFNQFNIKLGLVMTRAAGDEDPDPLTETSSAGERDEADETPSTTLDATATKPGSGSARRRSTARIPD